MQGDRTKVRKSASLSGVRVLSWHSYALNDSWVHGNASRCMEIHPCPCVEAPHPLLLLGGQMPRWVRLIHQNKNIDNCDINSPRPQIVTEERNPKKGGFHQLCVVVISTTLPDIPITVARSRSIHSLDCNIGLRECMC